jgi:murein DD-endopeptidase
MRKKLSLIAAATIAVTVTGGLFLAAPANAATTYTGNVPAGTTLSANDTIRSNNGQFRVVAQSDGNLVEYGAGNAVLWQTKTNGNAGGRTVPQTDGNLVVYSSANKVLWQSGTSGTAAASFSIGDDGNLVMRKSTGAAIWTSQSYQDTLLPGSRLTTGQGLRSDYGNNWRLAVQSDGNVVTYNGAASSWQTKTSGNSNTYLTLQNDGNVVVYSSANKPLWQSGTSGKSARHLTLQSDGNLVLTGTNGSVLWSSRTISASLVWPSTNTKVSDGGQFGADRGPTHSPRYHQGIDLALSVGTPLYGSGNGTVTGIANTGTRSGYGLYVTVAYGNVSVITAHMSSTNVSVGQAVNSGTLLGKSGGTKGAFGAGASEGPHCHVEVRNKGALVNPNGVFTGR